MWSIDAQAVTLSKMADLASSTLLGRATVGAGVAEALTPAQVRTLLNVAAGATANSADVVLLARANHTGTQLAATISDFSGATRATDLTGYTAAGARLALAAGDTVLGAFGKVGKWLTDLAAVAFSGSASDLTAGTLPAARFDDTAHGARAGGTLHANVVAAGAAGFMTGADKARLDGVSGTNTGDQTITLTGDVTGGGTGSFAATIAAAAVTLAQMANVATGTVFYRKTAGTGAPEVQTLGTLKTDLGLTGTNSGDQTSIVGLTGTKAQFDTAVTDGNILFVGDVTTNATHTGDATGATVLTLATVNANVGSFGLAGSVAQFVVNAKGLITSAANVAISVAATAISDSTAAGRAMLTAATATAQTALLDVATAALKGLMSGADKTKLDGVATGATANSADATLLARANHTGTQLAATISDATLAGHAMLTAATTAAQTALLDAATTTLKGLLTGTDKTKLDGVATGATANSADATLLARANHTGTQLAATISDLATAVAATAAVTANTAKVTNATHTGDVTGAGALTIAANAVDNTKAADMPTASIKGRVTAATGDPEDLTGTQTTTLLDPFTSLLKGLVPASGGGTTNFIRADGVWAPPAGAGDVVGPASATDNALARFNLATGKLIKNSVNPASNAGEIGFPFVASPATPPASQVNLYGTDIGLNGVPGFIGPDGVLHTIQSDLGEFNIARFAPQGTTGAVATDNSIAVSVTGVATATVIAPTNLHAMMRRVELLVTTAAATAVAGLRAVNNQWRVGKSAAAPGGFLTRIVWGPATGVATTTNRAFCGMRINAAPTDVEPSSLLNIVGMGWDAADTNIQMMYNDGTGTATKVDLGASFPVPTVDRQEVYEVQLFSPSSLTQSVSYRVIRYNTTDKTILAQASGTLTTDLPVVTQLLVPAVQMSVGGTSSVIGLAVMGILVATAY